MTYAKWDEAAIAKGLNRLNNAERVKNYIKEPLEEVMTPLLKGKELLLAESINVRMLLIFTHIDLLGYLYTGDSSPRNSSKNAVAFLRKYLGRVDKRYEKVGGLLYDALRHGLVHLATPKRIQLKDGRILNFSFGGIRQREDYLKVTKTPEIQRTGERVEIYRLFLDLSLLYEDLLSAINSFAEDISQNQELSDVSQKAFEARRKPEKAKEEELLNKPYIQDSDFAFVREQISRL